MSNPVSTTGRSRWIRLRWVISAVLVVGLLATIDVEPLRAAWSSFSPAIYSLAVAAMACYVVLASWVLGRLLRTRGLHLPLGVMVRFSLVSSFFGIFLPGGAGADLVMALRLCRDAKDRAGVLSAILFARVAGLLAMVAVALVVALIAETPFRAMVPLAAAILAGAFVVAALNRPPVVRVLRAAVPVRWREGRVVGAAERMLAALREFSHARALVLPGLGLLAMAVSRGGMDYLVARSLGVDLPPSWFLVFSTAVSIITLLPVSVAGIGVREMSYAGLFAASGADPSLGVAVSLLSFSLSLWVAVVGGILFAVHGWTRNDQR